MEQEVKRSEATSEHIAGCQAKLNTLLEQKNDLSAAIDTLLNNIEKGKILIKVYKQMKMYNDPNLNPILYTKK